MMQHNPSTTPIRAPNMQAPCCQGNLSHTAVLLMMRCPYQPFPRTHPRAVAAAGMHGPPRPPGAQSTLLSLAVAWGHTCLYRLRNASAFDLSSFLQATCVASMLRSFRHTYLQRNSRRHGVAPTTTMSIHSKKVAVQRYDNKKEFKASCSKHAASHQAYHSLCRSSHDLVRSSLASHARPA